MKELVEVIAKALVDNPEEVVVTESMKGEDTLIELKVSPATWARSSASRAGLQRQSVPLSRPLHPRKTRK